VLTFESIVYSVREFLDFIHELINALLGIPVLNRGKNLVLIMLNRFRVLYYLVHGASDVFNLQNRENRMASDTYTGIL